MKCLKNIDVNNGFEVFVKAKIENDVYYHIEHFDNRFVRGVCNFLKYIKF